MITASVKLRIVRPIDTDWASAGQQLHALSWIAHRVLNGAMSRMAMAAEVPGAAPDEWRSKRNPGSVKRPGGKLSSYQMAHRALAQANAERVKVRVCKWCAGTGVEPAEPPPKVRRTKRQEPRAPGEPCGRCNGAAEQRIGEHVDVPSAVLLGWSRLVERRHRTDRGDVLAGRRTVSSWRAPAPIMVTSSGEAFRLRHDGRGYVLDVPLYSGGQSGMVSFVVAPDGRGAHAHVRRALGEGRLGDLKIMRRRGDRKGWLAVLSYSWQQPEIAPGETAADMMIQAIRGGARPGICLLGPQFKRSRVLHGLDDIMRQRRKFSARRKSRSRHQRDLSPGARGHGRQRALRHYHAVDDAQQRWTRSVCQQIAAKAARTAIERGARWVQIDETSLEGVLPPATLREAVQWALTRAGLSAPKKTSPATAGKDAGGSL